MAPPIPIPQSAADPSPPGEVEVITDRLETPSLDDRSYRVIRLPNQLEALIVHDPKTDKASAAMDVNVGSFSDEDEMPGMAHAVEHVNAPPVMRPEHKTSRASSSVLTWERSSCSWATRSIRPRMPTTSTYQPIQG